MIKIEKLNENRLLVCFLQTKGEIQEKTIKLSGRKYGEEGNKWTIPNSKRNLRKLIELFDKFEIKVGDKVIKEYGLYCKNIFTIREKLEDKIQLAGFSFLTFKAYLMHIEKYLEHFQKDPCLLDEKAIKEYILTLKNKDNSASYINQAISAIKFLYEIVLEEERKINKIRRPKKPKKLPNVLSVREVKEIIKNLDNLKHKAILLITYSGGLRVSEVVKLKSSDIDSDRMLIHVRKAKGKKDRYTLLSSKSLHILRNYYRKYQPRNWLFPGRPRTNHLSTRSVQRIFKKACKKAKINKDVSIHSLRHSFATHLMDNGTDLKHIQKLMGHKSLKTTERYTHVTNRSIENIISPLDRMD